MAQKVRREGRAFLAGPTYISDDIFVMVRQAIAIYNLLFYLNADERRESDCYWNPSYGVVSAPLVRSMIDCLYNVTAILQDPATNGPAYRKGGLKKRLMDLAEDQVTYAGKAEWDEFNSMQLKAKSGALTPHQHFLKLFTHMQWRQYSALAHGGFEGYIGEHTPGAYLILDSFKHEDRPRLEARYSDFLTRHIGRAATVLLCISTELQAHFRFDGANINDRICKMWEALRGYSRPKNYLMSITRR